MFLSECSWKLLKKQHSCSGIDGVQLTSEMLVFKVVQCKVEEKELAGSG